MANVAQLVNNLHALFLAGGKNCITTPTYHVFDMYKEHQGAQAITTTVTDNETLGSSVSVSASVKDGRTLLTIGNLSQTDDAVLTLEAVGAALPARAEATLLWSDDVHTHNTFDAPENIKPSTLNVDLTKPVTVPRAGILAIRF